MAIKQKVEDSGLPPVNFYYTIPLDNDNLILTKEVLYEHYRFGGGNPPSAGRATVPSVTYEKGLFILLVAAGNDNAHQVYVGITRNELHVACDCMMPNKTLCHHAYSGMFYLMHHRDMNLEPYYWPELQEEERKKLKYLYVDTDGHHVHIYPRPQFGNLYKLGWGFSLDHYHQFDVTTLHENNLYAEDRSGIGYTILYTELGLWYSQLPILIPFIGKAAKRGDRIVSFGPYLRKDKAMSTNVTLTDNQNALNEIGFEMFTLVRSVGRQDAEANVASWLETVPTLIRLWQNAVPLLFNEPYVYSCQGEGLLSWKNKPAKSQMRDWQVASAPFVISFLLIDHKDHLILEPVITSKGRQIKHYRKVPLFLIDARDGTFFLVQSAQDEALLNWLRISGNKLTVLKGHFADFHERFLDQLSKRYTVVYQPFRSKKKVLYALNEVIQIKTPNDGRDGQ